MSNQPPAKRYYPRISSVISENDIPDILGFIKTGIVNLLDNIYFKDLQYDKSPKGDSAFYSLSVVSPRRIDIEIPGTGIFLVLNPDLIDGGISAFPITIEYQWKILAYLRSFTVGNFSFDPQQIFEVALRVLNITEEQALAHFINAYVKPINDSVTSVQQFVNDLNKINPDWNLPVPNEQTQLTDVVTQIYSKSGRYASLVAFSAYLLSSDLQETTSKVKNFFKSFMPQDIDEYIKDIIIPKFRATLLLSAGIEFPRNILVPVYPEGTKDETDPQKDISLEPIPGNEKVTLTFAEALFYADTEKGFGYNMDLILKTNHPAQIGNTGLIIDIHNLKIDISKTENIAEADADGRPKDFMGVYMEYAEIFLPKKWFNKNSDKSNSNTQTIGISANHLLVGTGGVSGNIAIRATYKSKVVNNKTTVISYYQEYFNLNYSKLKVYSMKNPALVSVANHAKLVEYINTLDFPSQLKFQFPLELTVKPSGEEKVISSEAEYYNFLRSLTFDTGEFIWFNLGDYNNEDNKKYWRIGFKKFDIDFHQGKVVHSSLDAALEIPKFKNADGSTGENESLIINFKGEWESKENFKLSANFIGNTNPVSWTLFKFVTLTIQSAELGSKDNNFFIGADTKLKFPDTGVTALFKGKEIDLPAIRIYSNGRFEIAGGIGFIPVNITLPLGPVEMAVTGIHLGSVQKEREGKIRNYNYIGFDGSISVDPGGVEVKGNGIKYYYTVDNDEVKDSGHSYLHISTLEVDLVIPGTATEEQAVAIIKGSLTLPDPGVSEEFAGSVSVKLPQANIAGAASLRLNPKRKSFLATASVEFPAPLIPLGPLGVYGFAGLIGKKYVADKKAVFGNDADQKSWYDYYMAEKRGVNVNKFIGPPQTDDYKNPFSAGLGASIATMDGGKTLSLRAMMLLSLPNMFAIDAGLAVLTERLGLSDDRTAPFYAFIIIGDSSLEFGAGANYQLNNSKGWFIEIKGEVQAGFFFKNQKPWYVNFGTRQKPITATLFKDILNMKAESYLMISAAGIEAGAKVGFDFDLIIGRAWVIVEVGTQISFERPQIGGYMYIEGGLKINFFIVEITVAVSIFFSIEMIKPFLIFAQLRIQLKIKVFWFLKIKINVLLTLKWEKSNRVERDAIAPLTYQNSTVPDYPKNSNVEDYVKGVNMLSNEIFKLQYLRTDIKPVSADNPLPTYPFPNVAINAIIPMDTFIDIKFEKGVIPSMLVDSMIGSNSGQAGGYLDLIPPRDTAKGGISLRQVKHQYSIEEIEILMAVQGERGSWSWAQYHPYEALFEGEDANLVRTLKTGHWQKNSDRYDTIRLLATTPFSYLDGGEPGWMIPEQYGITSSSLFCTYYEEKWSISNFLNIDLGTEYTVPSGFNAYLISGLYYNLDGTYTQTIEVDENGNTIQVISDDKMVVRNSVNPFNFSKSLEINNGDKLFVTFPEPTAKAEIRITTYAQGVTIKLFKKILSNSINVKYEEVGERYYSREQLNIPIEVSHSDLGNIVGPISKIEIAPFSNNKDRIEEISQEIVAIWAQIEADAVETGVIKPTIAQTRRLALLKRQLALLKNEACQEITCKNLNFNVISNAWDGKDIESYSMVVNSQQQFTALAQQISPDIIIPDIDFNINSIVIINNDNQTYFPEVVKIVKTSTSLKIQLNKGQSTPIKPSGLPYLIIKTEKLRDLPVIFLFDDCNCSDTPCQREDVLCDYFDQIKETLNSCVDTSIPFIDNVACFDNIYTMIDDFDKRYPQYAIGDSFDFPDNWDYDPDNPPTVEDALIEAYGIIDMVKREKGNCGCASSDGGVIETVCTTALQQIRWLSMIEHEYVQTFPNQDAVMESSQQTQEALKKTIQPIWRPNTKYLLRFRLKDSVDNGSADSRLFDYYYGFKTVGPVGHFHKQNDNYLSFDGIKNYYKPDEKPLTSLGSYLDYKRSYPNPDGNLLGSKPLFYGHNQCKIDLFFEKAYMQHMLGTWPPYNDAKSIRIEMPIIIKDPVSEVIVPYPLPIGWEEEDVPGTTLDQWDVDTNPNLPLSIQTYINLWNNAADMPPDMTCKFKLGKIETPPSVMKTVTLTDLKPEKLYTAQIYSAYYADGNGEINDHVVNGKIVYSEKQIIHEFGFITSRYKDFREQVMSYNLNDTDDGKTLSTKQAVYNLPLDLSYTQILNLYALVSNNPNADTVALREKYMDEFDRAIEGVLKMTPLNPPTNTDFIKIIDSNTNDLIAIIVRNPEPFNDPKIPKEEMGDALVVADGKGSSSRFKVLWSKDYAQAIIMHYTLKFPLGKNIKLQFSYKTWDGIKGQYIIKEEPNVEESETLYTVVTEEININN